MEIAFGIFAVTRPLEEGCYGEVRNGSSTVEACTIDFTYEMSAGEKRLLLPMASVGDIPTIPGELFAKFQTGFYSDPTDAAFKALGVE